MRCDRVIEDLFRKAVFYEDARNAKPRDYKNVSHFIVKEQLLVVIDFRFLAQQRKVLQPEPFWR